MSQHEIQALAQCVSKMTLGLPTINSPFYFTLLPNGRQLEFGEWNRKLRQTPKQYFASLDIVVPAQLTKMALNEILFVFRSGQAPLVEEYPEGSCAQCSVTGVDLSSFCRHVNVLFQRKQPPCLMGWSIDKYPRGLYKCRLFFSNSVQVVQKSLFTPSSSVRNVRKYALQGFARKFQFKLEKNEHLRQQWIARSEAKPDSQHHHALNLNPAKHVDAASHQVGEEAEIVKNCGTLVTKNDGEKSEQKTDALQGISVFAVIADITMAKGN